MYEVNKCDSFLSYFHLCFNSLNFRVSYKLYTQPHEQFSAINLQWDIVLFFYKNVKIEFDFNSSTSRYLWPSFIIMFLTLINDH